MISRKTEGDSAFAHLYDDVQLLEGNENFSDEERLSAAVPALLSWFFGHARILPWRENPTPYRVWLSEIMLQQTRVEAVKPYFERFLAAIPDIRSLAEVDEERLLKLWEGLGYYNRARNLSRAASEIMGNWGGEMPSSYEKLLTLPGIGSYTAGAIASIAFGQKVPAVDGNVLRVISRVTASRKDIAEATTKKNMEELLLKIMPEDEPGAFNQALMEVGATVCIPRGKPICEECPFSTLCLAYHQELTEEIPVKKAAKARKVEERTVLLLHDEHRVLLQKRQEKGLLAGMYEYPNALGWLSHDEVTAYAAELLSGERPKTVQEGPEAVHIFSHVEWKMRGYLISIQKEAAENLLMADVKELKETFAIPNAFKAYTEKIVELLGENGNKGDISEHVTE
jgi:A/G-specific adenine glycosylase